MDLTKIDKPFGELDIETKVALFRAWCEGAVLESTISLPGSGFVKSPAPAWTKLHVYRVQPEPLRDISLPWHVLDKKWQWAARDENGNVWVYASKPNRAETQWWRGDASQRVDGLLDIDRGNKPWDQSMIQRPERPEGV